jgi:hypothetical protein
LAGFYLMLLFFGACSARFGTHKKAAISFWQRSNQYTRLTALCDGTCGI